MIAQPRPPLPPAPVLVVGLGRAGEAAAGALAARLGPDAVCAADDASTEQTRAAAGRLEEIGVRVVLGKRPAEWPAPAAVVKSPGIPPGAPCLPAGVPTIDELELGWRLTDQRVVAVTGTNGKGTTSWLLTHMLEAAQMSATLCGNFEFGPPISAAALSARGVLVVEASSFQIEVTDSLLPELAILTNLGTDHGDRYDSPEAYAAAKRPLFVRGDRAVPVAVLNADDGFARQLAGETAQRGARVVTFGEDAEADYRIDAVRFALGAAELDVDVGGERLSLRTRLPGLHNAYNAVGALAAAEALGAPRAACVTALAEASGVPGRFEVIDVGQPFTAVVDYAHNPDGYRAALTCARRLAAGKLRVLIGAAGGMDPYKRPAMGRLAATLADHVFVSNSEDRGESREQRVAHIMEGAREGDAAVVVELDRRRAIEALVAAAEPGDLVLVLGRGAYHRPLGDDGDTDVFDDRDELRAALSAWAA